MSQYRAIRGLNYVDASGAEKRVEAGDTFDDMNADSLKDEIEAGHVVEVADDDPKGEVVTDAANVQVYTTDPDSVSKPVDTVIVNEETQNPLDVASENPVNQTSGAAEPSDAPATVNPIDAEPASEPATAPETAPDTQSGVPAPESPPTATTDTATAAPDSTVTPVVEETATDSTTAPPQEGKSA